MPIERRSATLLPRILVAAVIVAAAFPVVMLVVSRTGRTYLPVGDYGVFDLRLRDVFSTDTPLTGVYSRYGWNHPGPLFYYALTPLSLVTGHAAWATQVGTGLLQGVAIVWGGVLAYRRFGPGIAAGWLLLLSIAYGSTGSWVVLQPWNPNVALPWFALFLLLCWVIAVQARTRDVLAGLAVLTFLIQTHAGYAPFVLVGLVALVLAARSGGWSALTRPAKRGFLLRALALLVILWLPVVIDAILYPPGNLWRIVRYFFQNHPGQAPVGLSYAARLVARPFAWPLPWLGKGDDGHPISNLAQESSAWWLLLPVMALIAAGIVAHRRGQRAARTAVILAATTLVVGLLAMSRVTQPAIPYLFYWRLVLAPLVLGTALAVLLAPLAEHLRRHASWGLAAATAASLALTLPLAVGVVHDTTDSKGVVQVVRAFNDELKARGLPDRPVLIRFAGSPLLGLQGGLVDAVARRTSFVRVDLFHASQFGRQRGVRPDQVQQVWVVIEQGEILSQLAAAPHAQVLARWTPLSAGDEAKLESLQRDLVTRLDKLGQSRIATGLDSPYADILLRGVQGLPPALVQQEERLSTQAVRNSVCRCAVVAFPSNQVPNVT